MAFMDEVKRFGKHAGIALAIGYGAYAVGGDVFVPLDNLAEATSPATSTGSGSTHSYTSRDKKGTAYDAVTGVADTADRLVFHNVAPNWSDGIRDATQSAGDVGKLAVGLAVAYGAVQTMRRRP